MKLTIILVSPARAENIGAAARAMKTMGFNRLRIVNSEAWCEDAAKRVAHGSGDILDHDVDFTIATTARSRAKFHYYATPQQLVPLLAEKRQWIGHCALVFGREDSGLTNDELALADILTGVPNGGGLSVSESGAGGDGIILLSAFHLGSATAD